MKNKDGLLSWWFHQFSQTTRSQGITPMAGDLIQSLDTITTPEDQQMRSVSEVISILEAQKNPLDTMLRRMKAGEKPKQMKHEWMEEGPYPRLDTVTVESAEGAAGATKELTVANAGNWRKHDIVRFPSNWGIVTLVVEAVSSTTITVRALSLISQSNATGLGTVPLIAADTVIAWAGNAKTEKAAASNSRSMVPEFAYNMCEYSDGVIDISEIQKNSATYGGSNWTRNQRRQLAEFRKSLEFKNWFGKISESIDPDSGEKRWTRNGVVQYITKTLNYFSDVENQPKITETMIIDWLVEIFGGNNGSETRFLFGDTYLLGEIMKVDLVNLRSREITRVLGVKCEKLEFNFGEVYLVHQRAFNEWGKTHYGVVLDLENIYKHDFIEMSKNPIEVKKSTGAPVEKEAYSEVSTISVRNVPAHAILEGIPSPEEEG